MSTFSLPPRGWYPDPAGSSAWRWWDGTQWTDDLEPYATVVAEDSRPLFATEKAAASAVVPVGLSLLLASFLLAALIFSVDLPSRAALVRWTGHAFTAALRHKPRPVQPGGTAPSWTFALTWILYPLQIIGAVLVLKFQYRAAKTARSLGLTASLGPALGVWGWFLPVANLILPYLAWRDLLPPPHPFRRRLLLMWILMLSAAGLYVAATLLSPISISLARGLVFGVLVAQLAVLRLAPSAVRVILEHHQQGTIARHGSRSGL